MTYFFDGYLGLLDSGGTELSGQGYARVPVQFTALLGNRETRPLVRPVLGPLQSAWPLVSAMGLFVSPSGSESPVMTISLTHWPIYNKTWAYAPDMESVTLLLNASAPWSAGMTVGRTLAGGSVVAEKVTSLQQTDGNGELFSMVTVSDESGNGGSSSGVSTVPVISQTVSAGTYALAFPADGSDIEYRLTPTQALTLTISGGKSGVRQQVTLVIVQPSGSGYAVTLPTGKSAGGSVGYPDGTAPAVGTTGGEETRIVFETDGYSVRGGV